MRFGKIAYVPGAEERDLFLVYTRLQENLQLVLSRTHFSFYFSQNGLHSLFIGRKRNHQIHSSSSPESPLTQLLVDRPIDQPKCAVDRPVDRAKSCKIAGLTRFVGRPTKWVSLLSIIFDRLSGRPIQSLCLSIARPIDWSPVIKLKNFVSCFYPLYMEEVDAWLEAISFLILTERRCGGYSSWPLGERRTGCDHTRTSALDPIKTPHLNVLGWE